MSTIIPTRTQTRTNVAFCQSWANLANGDDGEALMSAAYTDRSIQVFGTFGVGGNVRIEGSNDGIHWAVLTDPQGNNLDITSAKIELVAEATFFIRPRVTGGDGTTDLTVILLNKE